MDPAKRTILQVHIEEAIAIPFLTRKNTPEYLQNSTLHVQSMYEIRVDNMRETPI